MQQHEKQNQDQLIDDAYMANLRNELSPSTKVILIEMMREKVIECADKTDFATFKILVDEFRSVCELIGSQKDSVECDRLEFEKRKEENRL